MISKIEIDQCLESIILNKQGHYVMECPFTEFSSAASMGNLCLPDLPHMKIGFLRDKTQAVGNNLAQIGFLLFRIRWIKNLAKNDKTLENFWRQSIEIDIEKLLTNLRTMMDHWAVIIGLISNAGLQKSFNGLLKWCENEDNKDRIDPALKQTIIDCKEWFITLKCARESIAHHGATTLVFGDADDPVEFDLWHGEGQRVEELEKHDEEANKRIEEWKDEIIKKAASEGKTINFQISKSPDYDKIMNKSRRPIREREVSDYKNFKKNMEKIGPLVKGTFSNTIDFNAYSSYFIVKTINLANKLSLHCLDFFNPKKIGTNPQLGFTIQPMLENLYALQKRVIELEKA